MIDASDDASARAARIRDALRPLAALELDLVDDSARHAGHAGARSGGGHFTLRVVSARFAGQTRLARHRLVYDLLSPLMSSDIHAVSLVLLAPEEPPARLLPDVSG